ncbi:DMT family transporter [Vibrio zhanjiangensis]
MVNTLNMTLKHYNITNICLFISCVIIWSTSWLAITTQISNTAPAVSLFWRFFLASVTLCIVDFFHSSQKINSKRALFESALIGISYYFLGIWLTYEATYYIPSAFLACLSTTAIFFTLFIKKIFWQQPLLKVMILGALISTLGLTIFFFDQLSSQEGAAKGVALALLSFFLIAVGSVVTERVNKKYQMSSIKINKIAIFTACIAFMITCVYQNQPLSVPLSAEFLLPLFYLGIVCSALAFVLFTSMVSRMGTEYAQYVVFIYPLVATYIAYAVGEISLSFNMVLGSVLVIIGFAVGMYNKPSDVPQRQEKELGEAKNPS